MIAILDYGLSNLSSIANALEYVGARAKITSEVEELEKADRLVLPGVGAFRDGINNLHQRRLDQSLSREVLEKKKPLLGICLGMQLLAEKSYEFGEWPGLNLVSGEVKRFEIDSQFKVPHVGWNDIKIVREHPILQGVDDGSNFYFVHSYHLICKDVADVIGVCDYGGPFVAIVARQNIVATQFHPEKSQKSGLQLLKNFINWQP